MSILVMNGRYEYGPTSWVHPTIRCNCRRIHFSNINCCTSTGFSRTLPIIANIKQNWNKNVLTFRKGKSKIRVSTKEKITTSRQCLPIHAEAVNMMEGLDEIEEKQYFNDNAKIIPLFEVDIVQALTPYVEEQPDTVPVDEQTLKEIRLQQEA